MRPRIRFPSAPPCKATVIDTVEIHGSMESGYYWHFHSKNHSIHIMEQEKVMKKELIKSKLALFLEKNNIIYKISNVENERIVFEISSVNKKIQFR